MSKARRIVGVALFTLLPVASAFAAQGVTSCPADKPIVFALPHQVTGKSVWLSQTSRRLTTRTSAGYTPGGKISTPDGLGGAKKRSWLGAEASAKQRSTRRG